MKSWKKCNFQTILTLPSNIENMYPAISWRSHCKRAGWFQSGEEHQRANRKPPDPLRETPAASVESLPCLKKACDRVWHEALWTTMRKNSNNGNIIRVIVYFPLCLWELDRDCGSERRIRALEMRWYVQKTSPTIIMWPISKTRDTTGMHDDLHWEEAETQMVWPHLKILWHGYDSSAGIVKGKRERERDADRRRDGKKTSNKGPEWDLGIPWGRWRTGKCGKVLLQRHLWCPDDSQG